MQSRTVDLRCSASVCCKGEQHLGASEQRCFTFFRIRLTEAPVSHPTLGRAASVSLCTRGDLTDKPTVIAYTTPDSEALLYSRDMQSWQELCSSWAVSAISAGYLRGLDLRQPSIIADVQVRDTCISRHAISLHVLEDMMWIVRHLRFPSLVGRSFTEKNVMFHVIPSFPCPTTIWILVDGERCRTVGEMHVQAHLPRGQPGRRQGFSSILSDVSETSAISSFLQVFYSLGKGGHCGMKLPPAHGSSMFLEMEME